METAGRLINTRLCLGTLKCAFFPPAVSRLEMVHTGGVVANAGVPRQQATDSKSIRSEIGIIKIAICCPFRDIMLSIKHLIRRLGSTQAGLLMARGLLTLTSAVTMLG